MRQALTELDFFIIEENMVLEDGKYYPMMLAVRAGADWDVEVEMRSAKTSAGRKASAVGADR